MTIRRAAWRAARTLLLLLLLPAASAPAAADDDRYAATARLAYPPPRAAYRQHADLATLLASELAFTAPLRRALADGQLVAQHRVCTNNSNTRRCTAYWDPRRRPSAITPHVPVVLHRSGATSLVLEVKICNDHHNVCSTTASPPIVVDVLPCESPASSICNSVLATASAISTALADPAYLKRFAPRRLQALSGRAPAGLSLRLLSPHAQGVTLHQIVCALSLVNADGVIFAPVPERAPVVCVELRFGVYANSPGSTCLRYPVDFGGTAGESTVRSIVSKFGDDVAKPGLVYVWLSLWLTTDDLPNYSPPPRVPAGAPDRTSRLLEPVPRPPAPPDLRSQDVGTAILANSLAFESEFAPAVLGWAENDNKSSPAAAFTEPRWAYLTFAWSEAYVESAAVLARSLREAKSRYPLVAVVPRASLANKTVTPAALAQLQVEADRVVLLDDDITPLYHGFPSKVFVKLLALGRMDHDGTPWYDCVAVLDADAVVLSGPRLDTVFQLATAVGVEGQHHRSRFRFLGIGGAVLVGSLWVVVSPSTHMRDAALQLLRETPRWRMHEMDVLNALFGSGSFDVASSRFRLDERFSCTATSDVPLDECASFDFGFCSHKPWDEDALAGGGCRTGMRGNPLMVGTQSWEAAVRKWRALRAAMRRPSVDVRAAAAAAAAAAAETEVLMTVTSVDHSDRPDGKIHVVVRILDDTVNLPVSVCARVQGSMHCERVSTRDASLLIPRAPGLIGQQRVVAFCIAADTVLPGTVSRDGHVLQRLSLPAHGGCGRAEKSFEVRPATTAFDTAQAYVSGGSGVVADRKWEVSGAAQFQLLRNAGLTNNSRVLEFGCGTLNLARFLFEFLLPGHYSCVEPNDWLITSSLRDTGHGAELMRTFLRAQARVVFRDDFIFATAGSDAPPAAFDFIFAHSVVSHVGDVGMRAFLRATQHGLRPGGVALVSMCFCSPCPENPRVYEGDAAGGACRDSHDKEWVYPWVSYFRESTLARLASEHGLSARRRPDVRREMMARSAADGHDWALFTHHTYR